MGYILLNKPFYSDGEPHELFTGWILDCRGESDMEKALNYWWTTPQIFHQLENGIPLPDSEDGTEVLELNLVL